MLVGRALFLVAGLVGVVSVAGHGYTKDPLTRSAYCKTGGANSVGCKALIGSGQVESVYTPQQIVFQHQKYQDYRGTVPNGKICSAASRYDKLDLPAVSWNAIDVPAGGELELTYHFTAFHTTARLVFLITKQGTDHTRALTWSDLVEIASFEEVVKPDDNLYHGKAKLPPGLSGRHVLATMWLVSDSHGTKENFISCSDINIGGTGDGNGNGTGDGNGSPTSPPQPTTARPAPPPPTAQCSAPTSGPTTITVSPAELPLKADAWTNLCAGGSAAADPNGMFSWTVTGNHEQVVVADANTAHARIRLAQPSVGAVPFTVNLQVGKKVDQTSQSF